MKTVFTFIAGLLFATLTAQSFTVSTTHVLLAGNVTSASIPSAAWTPKITNISNDTLTLRWVRVEQNIPPYWRSSVCTEYHCSSIPDDSLEWKLLPGDSDMTYIHIYPYNFADTGNVVLKIFNVNDPADSVRIVYHVDVMTGIAEHSNASFIRADLFSHAVEFSPVEQGTWTLTDISGKVIVAQRINPGQFYSAAVPNAGVYFFTFVGESGYVEVHKLIL